MTAPIKIVTECELSNAEFLERYAREGCVGLAGGPSLVDKAIRRAQRRQRPDRSWSEWGHAFVFQGRRPDGHHWVIESDLEFHRRNIRLGVQENRITKYHDEDYFQSLAILDFHLEPVQVSTLIAAGLDLVATNTKYSLREILGTYLALHNIGERATANRMQKERSLFCSAFVRHLYSKVGLDFAPQIHEKHTTPEDIAQTTIPHTLYLLRRQVASLKD